MRRGPVVHGALLAAALGVAWQTWTRDRDTGTAKATVTVWPGAGAVESVALRGKLREVTIERRAGDYFWATVKKSTPPPPPKPAAPDAGPAEELSVPEEAGTTTTTQFPIGEEGEKALARLVKLDALRDLGKSTAREEYGLGDEGDRLTIKAGGATHELVLGAKVFGGDDRYVLEPAGGHVFVVAGEVLRPFDAPEFSMRERKLHGFAPADVAAVVVRVGGKQRTLVKKSAAPDTWADEKSQDKPDQTLANFMERVEQLAPTEYAQAPEPTGLTAVGTIEYRGKGGKVLGSLELSKRPAPAAGQSEYYVKSERTRVLAKVSPMAAARVDQDLAQIVQ